MRARLANYSLSLVFRCTPRTHRWGYQIRCWSLRAAGYQVGREARVVGTVSFHSPNVVLGDGVFLADSVGFYGNQNSRIVLSRGTSVGPRTVFIARSHHIGPPSHRAGAPKDSTIIVGEGVWIGAMVTIIGPSTVGDGAVIPAGLTIRGDVPANVLFSPHGVHRPLKTAEGFS